MSRPVVSSSLLFLVVLIVYLANGRTIGAGDTLPAAYLPWSLLRQANFDLDEFRTLHDADERRDFPLLDGVPYYLQRWNGHYLSAYSPGPGVTALPVHALPIVLGVKPDATSVARLEKLAAAIITALSVVLLHRALTGVTSRGWSLVLALVYALGTSSLSMSSQGLWQHGPSQLFLALALCFLVKGLTDERYLGYAGFPMAAAVVMRSTDLLIVLPAAAWIVYAHRGRGLRLTLWALPPLAALAVYHLVYFGTTDHAGGHTTAPVWAFFAQTRLGEGLPGVLVSPSRGLFVYSPVLLFSLAGTVMVWRRGPALWRALSLGPPLVILAIGKWITWWGGHTWGPRLLADVDPILCFLLYPVVPLLERRRLVRVAFVLLTIWSIGAHALGAWFYDRRWDTLVPDGAYARLWPWNDTPLAFYTRAALAQLVGRARAPATTADTSGPGSADGLAAAYEVAPVPPEVMSGERLVVRLSAANVGRGVWPAAPEERDAVRLGWRWYRGDQEVALWHQPLVADVAPGRAAELEARIVSPQAPGEYTLVLALVAGPGAWFGEHGQKPVRLPVTVVPREIARTLSHPIPPGGRAPAATIATDRPSYRGGETLVLSVTLEYPRRPRNFDAYLVLQGPEGPPLFFDGHATPRAGGAAWPPWVRNLPLPALAQGRFRVPLGALPAGSYRWHVVVTEPGGYHALTRAGASFRIEP